MFYRSLTAKIALILIGTFILAGLAFGYLYHRQEKRGLEYLMLKQAQLLYMQIMEFRHWNAGYGGVYVLKKPGMKTNRYLYKVGPKPGTKASIRPEIVDSEGNTYTLKNPALMTRELAEMVKEETNIRFHLTSLKLINPKNKPDAFETDSLRQFEQGVEEVYRVVDAGVERRFRYMAPLKVEKSCLKCHGFQGYKLGDIRGGLSLDLPMKDPMSITVKSRTTTIIGGFSVLVVMILILWFSLRRMVIYPIQMLERYSESIGSGERVEINGLPVRNDELGDLYRVLAVARQEVEEHQHQMEDMAGSLDEDRRHDPLTGLHNRRHLYLEGPQLFDMAGRHDYDVSVMMVDLDHFKQVNDTYGHAAGDVVLVEVAKKLRGHSRTYDLLIRYGGEEFTLIILDCDRDKSLHIARRIRKEIEALHVEIEGGVMIDVTCSIGVTTGRGKEMEQLLMRADEAMYMAKEEGRNKVRHSEYGKSNKSGTD